MSSDSFTSDASSSATSSNERVMGKVKWFNTQSGFGFVTVIEGDMKDKDIFIHHSAIKVNEEQYRYLVLGEYIELTLTPSTDTKHEFQAINVTGIKGGQLMCETRYDNKSLNVNDYASKHQSGDKPAYNFKDTGSNARDGEYRKNNYTKHASGDNKPFRNNTQSGTPDKPIQWRFVNM